MESAEREIIKNLINACEALLTVLNADGKDRDFKGTMTDPGYMEITNAHGVIRDAKALLGEQA